MLASVAEYSPPESAEDSRRIADTAAYCASELARAPQAYSLRSASVWMLAANVIYAASQWGVLAVLAKLGTTEMVGQFILALSIASPVMAFGMLNLRGVQATDARDDYRFGHYLGLRLVTIGLASVVIASIGLALNQSAELLAIVAGVTLILAVDGLGDIYYGYLQRYEQLEQIARSKMLKGVLSVAGFVLATFLSGWFFSGLTAISAVRFGVWLWVDLPNARLVRNLQHSSQTMNSSLPASLLPVWEVTRLWSLAKLALPLGLVMLLIVLAGNIPRYYLEDYLNTSAVGIFGAICYLNVVGTLVVGAIGETASARLARHFSGGNRTKFGLLVLRLLGVAAALGVAGVVVAAVLGSWVLNLLYGAEYAEHANALVWVMVAAGIGYLASILGYGLTAARYFRSQIPLFVAVVLVAALCSWLWIPRFGLVGAAYALVASALVQFAGSLLILVYTWRESGRHPNPEVSA